MSTITVILIATFKERMRYKLSFILGILFLLVMGVMLAFGLTKIGVRSANFFIAYLLWSLYQSTSNSIGFTINQMATEGVLERIFTLPIRPIFVINSYNAVQFVEGFINFWIVMGIGYLIGIKFKFDIVSTLAILFIVLLFFAGLSNISAGLTLIYKRSATVIELVNVFLLGSGVYAVGKLSPAAKKIISVIPYTYAAHLLQRVEIDGIGFAEVLPKLPLLFLTSMCFLIAGIFIFEYCNKYARKRGTIGHF